MSPSARPGPTLEPLEDRLAPADLTGTFTRSFGRDLSIPDGPTGAAVGWDVDARSLPAGAVVTQVSVHEVIDHKRVGDLDITFAGDTGPTWVIRDNVSRPTKNINDTRVDTAILAGLTAGQVWHYRVRDTVKGTAGRLTQLDVTLTYTVPAAAGVRLLDTSVSTATTRGGQTVTLGYRLANDGPPRAVALGATLTGPNGATVPDGGAAAVTAATGTNWYYRTVFVNPPPGAATGAYAVTWTATPAQGAALAVTRPAALTVLPPVSVDIPVYMFHHIDYGDDPEGSTPEELRADILALKGYGYTFLTVSEMMDVRAGLRAAPPKPVVLTFDDGYIDFYTNALPVLQELGVKATVFIFTEGVDYDRTNIMSWDQLRAVLATGLVEVQGHTVSHAYLPQLTDAELRAELVNSKRELEQNLGITVQYLSYPYGAYDARVGQAAWAAGYAGAVLAWGGPEDTAGSAWEVSRIGVLRGQTITFDPL